MRPKVARGYQSVADDHKLSGSAAVRGVASACLGAELIRTSRASGSRRRLGKLTGIPSSVIADIEDGSVLPSDHQLAQLSKHLPGIRCDLFVPSKSWREIPWSEALLDLLSHGELQTVDALAQTLASAAAECEPRMVKWRLVRQLSRLESSGCVIRRENGTLESVLRNPAVGELEVSRRKKHVVTARADPEQDALFHVESEPGHYRIILNGSHPHYKAMQQLLSHEPKADLSAEELSERLADAAKMVRELLIAWAEYEDGEKVGGRQDRAREARQAWGRHARQVTVDCNDGSGFVGF